MSRERSHRQRAAGILAAAIADAGRLNMEAFRRNLSPRWSAVLVAGTLSLSGQSAQAQISSLLAPAYDPVFDRDRNQSVTERPRPGYDALGIRLGSMIANLGATMAGEYSSNVYTDNSNKIADAAVVISPMAAIESNWNNHSVRLSASGNFRRYATQTLANQNVWSLAGKTRLDVTRDLEFVVSSQIERLVESPFSDDLVANLTVPSRYMHKALATNVAYVRGRSRVTLIADVNDYRFKDILFANGVVRSQMNRDRTTYRGAAVYEYALSPSLSAYGQLLLDRHDYKAPLSDGRPNRDSTGWVIQGGANFDLAGLARGSVGVGYSRRNFAASQLYPSVSGISFQSKVEFFLSQLTTFGLTAQRQLQDNSLGDGAAQWDMRGRLFVDHALLRNMIVSASIEAGSRKYINFDSRTNFVDAGLSAQYQASRNVALNAAVNYGSSTPKGIFLSRPFDQFRVSGGVSLRI